MSYVVKIIEKINKTKYKHKLKKEAFFIFSGHRDEI